MENSIAVDYVTEKLYEPLACGSIPLYLGAPNVHEFAPDPDCFVDLRRFASPAELAQYVRRVMADPREFQRFHAWRDRPLPPEFAATVHASGQSRERLAKALHDLRFVRQQARDRQ